MTYVFLFSLEPFTDFWKMLLLLLLNELYQAGLKVNFQRFPDKVSESSLLMSDTRHVPDIKNTVIKYVFYIGKIIAGYVDSL